MTHAKPLEQDFIELGLLLRFHQSIVTLRRVPHDELCNFLTQSEQASRRLEQYKERNLSLLL